jgi:hypothetical protein
LRIADCGTIADCGLRVADYCGLGILLRIDCGLIADWFPNPHSAFRIPQLFRNPQSEIRNDAERAGPR